MLPHNYTLNSVLLNKVNDMKDLGIIIDNQLNFHLQTTQVVSKANRLLGVIKKSFEHISAHTLPLLYKTLVCLTLEYVNLSGGPTIRVHWTSRRLRRYKGEPLK